jgi:hypothetical protein
MSLATFFEIKEATANSIVDIEVMTAARDIAHEFEGRPCAEYTTFTGQLAHP